MAKWKRPRKGEQAGWGGSTRWARRHRSEQALVKHGGDPVAAAVEMGVTPSTMRRYLRAAGFREQLEAAMTAAGLTYESAMTVLKDGMAADKPVISTKTGEIIGTVADHPTRVGAAGKLLGVMSVLARAERPELDEDAAAKGAEPRSRPLTREEFFSLTEAGRTRVTMELQRVVVEPAERGGDPPLSWRERNRLGWNSETGTPGNDETGGGVVETGGKDG